MHDKRVQVSNVVVSVFFLRTALIVCIIKYVAALCFSLLSFSASVAYDHVNSHSTIYVAAILAANITRQLQEEFKTRDGELMVVFISAKAQG